MTRHLVGVEKYQIYLLASVSSSDFDDFHLGYPPMGPFLLSLAPTVLLLSTLCGVFLCALA